MKPLHTPKHKSDLILVSTDVCKGKDLPFGSSVDDQHNLAFQSRLNRLYQYLFPYPDDTMKKRSTYKVQITLAPRQLGLQIVEAFVGNVPWERFVTKLGGDAVEKRHVGLVVNVKIW